MEEINYIKKTWVSKEKALNDSIDNLTKKVNSITKKFDGKIKYN